MTTQEKKRFYKLANMSGSAYTNKLARNYVDKEFINGGLFDYSETDLEGFYGQDTEKNVYFVFRSTESDNLKEWLENFKFSKKKMGKYKVHQGIYDKLSGSAFNELKSKIMYYKKQRCKVSLIGHSLGGALARQLAFLLKLNNVEVDEIVTFGSYPTGTKSFNSLIKDKTINLVTQYDFVRILTWFMKLLGYKSKYVVLKHKGFYHLNYHFITFYKSLLK